MLTATLLAPSLVKLGVTPMAAHMFVMYFGVLSMVTPPAAIAAYAAANIARVPGWQTGWTAAAVGWCSAAARPGSMGAVRRGALALLGYEFARRRTGAR